MEMQTIIMQATPIGWISVQNINVHNDFFRSEDIISGKDHLTIMKNSIRMTNVIIIIKMFIVSGMISACDWHFKG